MSKLAKTARNAMIADVALAFARDRLATKLPGVEPRRKRSRGKLLLIGGAAVAGGALLLSQREQGGALPAGRAGRARPPPAGAAGLATDLQLRRARAGGEHLHAGAHAGPIPAAGG